MAITSTQQTDILKVVAGLFNAAPGGTNLSDLANAVDGGMTIKQLANVLASNTLFTNGIMAGKVTTDAQAAVLMNNFGLVADNTTTSAGSQALAYFKAQIDAKVSFGDIVYDAVTFLSTTTDATFTTAATLLANKALVAASYSATNSSSDLSVLQNVVSAVTGTAPFTAADVATVLAALSDDVAPAVTAPAGNFSFTENQAAAATLATIAATDNVAVTGFEIASGNDSGFFAIDAAGKITLTTAGLTSAANDFETTPNSFTLGVKAIDSAGNKSAAVDVILDVTDADEAAPTLTSQVLSGNKAIMTFNEAFDAASIPAASSFVITESGNNNIVISAVAVSGQLVTLTLATTPTGTTTVSYTPPGSSPLQDPTGNDVVAFTNKTLTVDTTAPTLSSSTPADNATSIAIANNLVLTFSEAVQAGTGNIVITNAADATDTRTIAVTDAQVTFSGSAVTINPTADLKVGANYNVQIAATAVKDAAGLAYAGISNSTALNFSTVAAPVGTTFVLTTSIDQFTGTSSDDTFIGDAGSTSLADTLVGGLGADTLQLFGGAAKPNFSGIETVFLSGNTVGFDVSDKADVTLLELVDPTTAQVYTTTTGQAVKVATMVATELITFAGNTPTSLAMTLNSVAATGADATIALTGTALTSLAITTATAASQVTLTNAGGALATVTVAGDKALELGSALTTISTINASASTGGVDVDAVGAFTGFAFTGGSGNDRIDLGVTLGATDAIVGGTGTDTIALSGAASATLTSTTGAKISGFEVLEIGETGDNTTYNVDNLIGTNTLTGVKLTVTGAGATTTVSNINAAATGNITFTGDEPEAVLTAKDFVAGGTSDTATINLNNDTSDNANGVDLVALTFANADVLNFVTTKSDTAGLQVNSVALTATDAEKITVTGNDSFSVTTSAGTVATEIDASGLTSTAALTAITTASAQASLLVKGTANVDALTLANAATLTTTLFTGGGSDILVLRGDATSVNTLKFTSTALNAGDVKAGNALTIDVATNGGAAGAQVILDFGSTFEGLLKIGGTVLGTSAGNVNAIAALGATTNVGVTATSATVSTFQIDLDGDGAYTAANDFQITITGVGGGVDTFIYNAANDNFVFTAV